MRPTALAATSARRFLAIFSLVVLVPSATNGFDLFIDADYGLNVLKWQDVFGNNPIYFVKDSRPFEPVLENPLFSLITLVTTNVLRFTWNSDENITYEWHFNSSDLNAMGIPYVSTARAGQVPKHEVFNLTFPCTGKVVSTTHGSVMLDYTFANGSSTRIVTGTRVRCDESKPPTPTSDGAPLWIIGVVIGGVIVIAAVVILICILVARRRHEKFTLNQLEKEINILKEDSESRRGSEAQYSRMGIRRETVEMRLKNASQKSAAANRKTELVMKLKDNWFESLQDCIIEENRVAFGEELGKGAFGFVYKGTVLGDEEEARKYTVALKTMKDVAGIDEMSMFLAEGIVMKDFKHPHVMGLIGVCFPEEEPPVIVLPFMVNGDLHTYLKKTRASVSSLDDIDVTIPYITLLRFIEQIASGMKYLSSQKFVHRDLATRNCMLDENLDVKVGDFGLAKEMHEDLYYRLGTPTKLPVKWMAIESLNEQIFTLQTDVWAFGVTVWEIMSVGRTPYPGVANYELAEYLSKGLRMQKPEACSEWTYELMRSCWAYSPSDRPTFSDIVVLLERHSRDNVNDNAVDYQNFVPSSKDAVVLVRQGSTVPDGGYAKLNPDAVFEEETDSSNVPTAVADAGNEDKTEDKEEEENDEYMKTNGQNGMKDEHKPNDEKPESDDDDDNDDEYLKMNAMSPKSSGSSNKNGSDDEYMRMTSVSEANNRDNDDDGSDSGGSEYLRMELKSGSDLQAEDDDESYMKMDASGKEATAVSAAAFVNTPDSEL